MDEPEDMADVFLFYGVKNAMIRLDACKVNAVDATGAGDNFIAGFASELLRGSGSMQALRFANACGAICCTAVGSSAALKGRGQVESLLDEN